MPEYPIGIDPDRIDTEAAADHAGFLQQSIEDQKKNEEAADELFNKYQKKE